MKAVTLYTTLGCHLCEEALAMLRYLAANGVELEIHESEIADSDELMDQYGIRIPVIRMGGAEIGWPFTIDELQAFLEG